MKFLEVHHPINDVLMSWNVEWVASFTDNNLKVVVEPDYFSVKETAAEMAVQLKGFGFIELHNRTNNDSIYVNTKKIVGFWNGTVKMFGQTTTIQVQEDSDTIRELIQDVA